MFSNFVKKIWWDKLSQKKVKKIRKSTSFYHPLKPKRNQTPRIKLLKIKW